MQTSYVPPIFLMQSRREFSRHAQFINILLVCVPSPPEFSYRIPTFFFRIDDPRLHVCVTFISPLLSLTCVFSPGIIHGAH